LNNLRILRPPFLALLFFYSLNSPYLIFTDLTRSIPIPLTSWEKGGGATSLRGANLDRAREVGDRKKNERPSRHSSARTSSGVGAPVLNPLCLHQPGRHGLTGSVAS
jgi:hypothetical protein